MSSGFFFGKGKDGCFAIWFEDLRLTMMLSSHIKMGEHKAILVFGYGF